ncbi:MAG TPA: hypothetical protein VE078_16475 [Thermoanaerobaculia bacterium]|nr:hypothetical protein [Thermoanaerobaculia bacterium]
MSLIDEALRRARQEAARQDSAKREAQYRQVPVYAPTPQRNVRPVLLGAAVALCIVAGVGIGVLLGRGGGEKEIQEPVARTVSEAPASPDVPVEEPDTIAIEESPPESEPVPTPSPVPEIERQQVPAAAAEPFQPPPVLNPEPPPPAVTEPKPAVPAPEVPSPEAPAAPEIRTYVREVPLPDGGTLRLSGIAFSAAQPVALIDDKVLAKGETYQGFVVADIQANLVELRGNGMTVRVTLK